MWGGGILVVWEEAAGNTGGVGEVGGGMSEVVDKTK